MRRSISSGFTLIELMVVVAVVAVLAGIVYPSYLDSVRKSRRADAKSVLLQASQWMERFYTENGRYDRNLAGSTITSTSSSAYGGPTQSPAQGTAYYAINFTGAPTQNAYTLSAAPSGNQTYDKCGTLTLTSTGVKGVQGASSGFDAARCW